MKGRTHGTGGKKHGWLDISLPLLDAGGEIEIIIRRPGAVRKFVRLLSSVAVNKIKRRLGLS